MTDTAREQKKAANTALLFLFIGIVFVILGCTPHIMERRLQQRCTVPIEATVIRVSFENSLEETPLFGYSYKGQTYEGRRKNSTFNEAGLSAGDKTIIYINPENPGEIFCPDSKTYTKVSIVTGAAMCCIGLLDGLLKLFGKQGLFREV